MRSRILFCSMIALLIPLCLTGCQRSTEPAIEHTQQTLVTENTSQTKASVASEAIGEIEFPDDGDVGKEIEETIETTEVVVQADIVDTKIADDELVEIANYIPNIVIDLKYATEDNFTGQQIYESNMPAMLRHGTVKKLMLVQEELNELGYMLVILDAYRPVSAQFKLWEVFPDPTYVANPNYGFSSHSRGNTVDVTIQKLNGETVQMPTEFDDFSALADRNYNDVPKEVAENALLLENLMMKHGFEPYAGEWWHFSDTTLYYVVEEE